MQNEGTSPAETDLLAMLQLNLLVREGVGTQGRGGDTGKGWGHTETHAARGALTGCLSWRPDPGRVLFQTHLRGGQKAPVPRGRWAEATPGSWPCGLHIGQ